jgi:hypothetical protein
VAVGPNPVDGLDVLRAPQAELATADQRVQLVLECVFGASSPTARVGLGPQVGDRVGSAQLQRNQVVNFVGVRDVDNVVAGIHGV